MKASKKQFNIRLLTKIIVGCLLMSCTFRLFDVQAQIVNNDGGQKQYISIVAGQSHVVKAPWPTIRVSVTDPEIADVKILTPDQILLQGLEVGSTDLIMWNEDETQIWQVAVNVTLDIDGHRQMLHELFPNCKIDLDQSGNVLIARGILRKTGQAAKLREYLEKTGADFIDMTSVAGVQQVQLRVRVAEVSREATRALGINAIHRGEDYFFGIRPGTESGGSLVPTIGFVPEAGTSALNKLDFDTTTTSIPSSITVLGGIPSADLEVFMKALAENQYLRILADPTLVALSGEEASFLAGGEFPIPVVQSSSGGTAGTSITVIYKKFGVRLTFRPTVLGDGTIRLYTAPEVSDLTTVGSVTIEGFEIPALTTRKAETTIELKNGQTFAMAGLLQNNINAIKSRVPGLGDLPVIGQLFRSVRYSKEETELVIMVTASLVEPMSLAQAPPLPGFLHNEPNDWEFYIEGKIDGSEPAKLNPADAEWMRQMGLDQLMGPGAWDYYDNPAGTSRSEY